MKTLLKLRKKELLENTTSKISKDALFLSSPTLKSSSLNTESSPRVESSQDSLQSPMVTSILDMLKLLDLFSQLLNNTMEIATLDLMTLTLVKRTMSSLITSKILLTGLDILPGKLLLPQTILMSFINLLSNLLSKTRLMFASRNQKRLRMEESMELTVPGERRELSGT